MLISIVQSNPSYIKQTETPPTYCLQTSKQSKQVDQSLALHAPIEKL